MLDDERQAARNALRAHVEALAVDIGPRTPFAGDSLERAATYIRSVLADAGYSVREQTYRFLDRQVANVIGTTAAAMKAPAYVVGAHYDTVSTTPGADDNASAVAVMLELARRVSKARLNVPLLFVAFTLEEPPAHMTRDQGSRVFARQYQRSDHRLRGAIILEMVGYTAPRQLYPFISRWPDAVQKLFLHAQLQIRRKSDCAYSGHQSAARIASTGQGACRKTCSVVLPRSASINP